MSTPYKPAPSTGVFVLKYVPVSIFDKAGTTPTHQSIHRFTIYILALDYLLCLNFIREGI